MADSRISNHIYSWVTSLPCLLSLTRWSMIPLCGIVATRVYLWSLLARRSMLGTSRRARLLELPLAAAAVRHGVQTVLCNCYPFLEKGSESGNEMLIALHDVSTHPPYQRRHPSRAQPRNTGRRKEFDSTRCLVGLRRRHVQPRNSLPSIQSTLGRGALFCHRGNARGH